MIVVMMIMIMMLILMMITLMHHERMTTMPGPDGIWVISRRGNCNVLVCFFSRMDAQQVKSGLDAGSSWGKTGCQMYKETEHGWLEYYFPIDGEAYFQGLR